MKVLIVSHSSGRSGAEKVVRLMADALPAVGARVAVTTPEHGPLTAALTSAGTPTAIAPVRWWTRPTSRTLAHFANRLEDRVDRLAAIVAEDGADVVLTNSMVIAEGALAAARLGLPHAWYVHEMIGAGEHIRPLLPLERLHGYMDALADGVFVASAAVGADLRSVGVLGADKIALVNYGLDPSPEEDAAARERSPRGAGSIVLFPARLTERKGIFTMLEAFSAIRAHVPDARLVLAGAASRAMRRRVDRFVADRGLAGVEVLGFVADMPSLMARADLVALPSEADPFPVAVLEAMALGTPVVGTHSGGMADQIVDGETGFLVAVRDHVALADRVVRLLRDGETRARMGAAAAHRLRAELPVARMRDTLADGLGRIVAAGRPADATRQAAAAELLAMSTRRRAVDLEEQAVAAAVSALGTSRRLRANLTAAINRRSSRPRASGGSRRR